MTETITPARITSWMEATTGEGIDHDGAYGAQCVDLVNRYAANLWAVPYSKGNGVDKAANMARDYGWEHIAQPALADARYGDILSLGTSEWVPRYGHTGIFAGDAGGGRFWLFDQGPSAGPARLRRYYWVDVVGLVRPPISGDTATVTIKPGDTLWRLSRRHRTTVPTLKRLNPHTDAENLQVGAKVLVPTAGTYTVVKGDTLWGIARAHGITLDTLVNLNGVDTGDDIHPGDVLKVA